MVDDAIAHANQQLIEAMKTGDAKAADAAFKGGANIFYKYDSGTHGDVLLGTAAMEVALENGHPEMLDLLIRNGVDINTQFADGTTLLMHAVKADNIDNIRALLAKGANVEIKNNEGNVIQSAFTAIDPNLPQPKKDELNGILLPAQKEQEEKYRGNGLFSHMSNWLAPLATVLGILGIGSCTGGIGIGTIIFAVIAGAAALLIAEHSNKSGFFAENKPDATVPAPDGKTKPGTELSSAVTVKPPIDLSQVRVPSYVPAPTDAVAIVPPLKNDGIKTQDGAVLSAPSNA
jgi:hypothetical protein